MKKLHQLFKHKKFPEMLLFYLVCPYVVLSFKLPCLNIGNSHKGLHINITQSIQIYLYLQPDFSYRIKIQQNSILPKVLCN